MANRVILAFFFLSWTLFFGHILACLTPGWAAINSFEGVDMNFGFLWYCKKENSTPHCYETDSSLTLSGFALLLSSLGYLFGVIVCSLNVTTLEVDKSYLCRVLLSFLCGGCFSLVALVSYAYLMEHQILHLVSQQVLLLTGSARELLWEDVQNYTWFGYSFYIECLMTSFTFIGLFLLGIVYRITHLEKQRESFYFTKM